MHPYPLKLCPVCRDALWGGTRLSDGWHKAVAGTRVAESWELTVRAQEMNTVLGGACDGMTLAAVFDAHPAWRGAAVTGTRFPLLIKFIDAAQSLSVQVHPDDAYAARVECDSGKNEMWYIVEAAPDAHIVYGLKPDVTAEAFRRAVDEGRIAQVLNHQPVRAGECYYIPAGLVHAIGAGILIAEIQQNSDLTYRVWDYDRRDANGRLRELHRDKACDVVVPHTPSEIDALRFAAAQEDEISLAHPAYFCVRRRICTPDAPYRGAVGADRFLHLLLLSGSATVQSAHACVEVGRGDSVLLPATLGDFTVSGDACWLESCV